MGMNNAIGAADGAIASQAQAAPAMAGGDADMQSRLDALKGL